MLFQGQNSHPSDLPGRTREVLAWFKFRLLLLQAWEDGGYPTSWRPTPSPWASDGRTLAGLLGGQGYFIIVGDYVVFRFFTRPAESSACNRNLMNPRRNPFAPSMLAAPLFPSQRTLDIALGAATLHILTFIVLLFPLGQPQLDLGFPMGEIHPYRNER
jgi:hypothetical protein